MRALNSTGRVYWDGLSADVIERIHPLVDPRGDMGRSGYWETGDRRILVCATLVANPRPRSNR